VFSGADECLRQAAKLIERRAHRHRVRVAAGLLVRLQLRFVPALAHPRKRS
jgi:hypothetical protein